MAPVRKQTGNSIALQFKHLLGSRLGFRSLRQLLVTFILSLVTAVASLLSLVGLFEQVPLF